MKLILFDMDHTLLDANKTLIDSFNKAFIKYHLKPTNPSKIKPLFGLIGTKIIKSLFPELTHKQCKEISKLRHQILFQESKKYIKPFPKTIQTLKKLKKTHKIGIVSNAKHNEILLLLKQAKINPKLFDVIVGNDDVKHPKPAPDEIFKAKKLTHLKPEYIVGDSIYDIKAGKRAKIKTIAVLTGNTPKSTLKKEKPDFILKNITEIPKIIISS